MDPIDLRATPRSGGSGGDGNRSVRTSSRRRRLTLSSTTGAELISEFDAAADGPGSGSSSPSAGHNLEVDETPYRRSRSRNRANPEDSPTANNLGRLLLVSPVRSAASTDDDVLIMDGVLVDSEPSTPSSARRSVSFVDDNEPSNRRSVSIADLVLVSSDSQGSSGGGSGVRGSGGQLHREETRGTQGQRNTYSEVVSPSLRQQAQGSSASNNHSQAQGASPSNINRQAQGASPSNINRQGQGAGPDNIHRPARGPGPSNIQQRQEFPLPHNFHRRPELPNFQQGPELPPFPPNFHLGHFPVTNPYIPAWVPPPPQPYFTYAPLSVTIPQPSYYPRSPLNFGRSPVFPPPGVTIRPAVERPPPPRRSDVRVVIRDPHETPVSEGGSSSAPAQPEASSKVTTSSPGDEGGTSAPKEQPETQAPAPPAQTFRWPPTSGESAAITQVLYGPSTRGRPRLPVFKDICPDDDEAAQPPSPPPPVPPSP